MTDTTMQGEQIGSVISLTGSVWAVSGTSQRPLTEGAPVYEGEEIVTESDSNVEIKFSDDTVLGQGEDSAVRLDDYVYTEDDNQLDFHMVKGVMRVVSGEIVKANPEGFNLSTPLATIGIRGTQVMVQVDNGREIIGVDELGEGHTVLVGNAFNQVVIDKAGMFSGVDFDGSLIAPDEMPTNFISTIVRAAPLTILGDPPREPGESQEVIPPEIYDTIDNQTGEIIPGSGAEEESENEDEEDDLGTEYEEDSEEEFELTEAEIEALLELETAAGTEVGGPTEEFGQVVNVNYDPFANSTDAGEGAPVQPPAQDDNPPDDTGGGDEDDTVDDTPAPPAEEVVIEQTAAGENEPVTFNVLNDAPEGSTLVEVELAEGEDHHEGEFEFEPEGTITYTPAEGEDGTVVIDYTIEDSLGGESSAQVSVTLADDSEPVIETTDATGTETAGVVTASGTITTDFGADAEGSSVELSSDGAYWDSYYNILVSADGSWDIELTDDGYLFTQNGALTEAATTDAGEALAIDVTVTATDSDGDKATGEFTVALTDDGPVASDVILTEAIEDTTISYNVFDNEDADTGLYGGTLTKATLAEDSTVDGKVSFDSDGNITFTPAANESGTASIEYTVTDSDGDTATAQMTIEVQPVNDAPEAEDKSFTSTEDTVFTITSAMLLEGSSDVENDTVSVVSVDGSDLPGTLVDNEDGSWTFTPGEDWNGDLSLSYTVTDGDIETSANIDLTISNDMTDLVRSSTVENIETTTTTDSEVTGVDTTVTVESVRDAETGDRTTTTTTTIDTETTTTDTTTIETTPVTTNVYEDGSEQVVFGETTTATETDTTVSHTISSEDTVVVDPNDAPTAQGKSFTFTEDTALTLTAATLLEGTSDADNDTVSVVSVDGTNLPGTLVANDNDSWTFTPSADWNGNLNLSYTVTDGFVETDANIALTVSNDMTDLVSSSTVDSIETTTTTDSEVTGVDTTVTVESVRDAETGDRTTTTTTTIDTETTTTDTTITETTPVTTNIYEDGSEQVVFGETTVTSDVDTTVAHALISEDLIVVDPNDAPEVEDKSFNFDEDTSITITSAMLLEGSSDAENDIVNVVSVNGNDLPGELVDNEDSTWTFTPETDWNGELTLSYTVTDGYVESDANISLTINPVDENNEATRGQDVITGTTGDDSIDGMQGKDIIYGTAGDDTISGSQGKDQIFGGTGNDTISGGQGHDELIGGAGDDELTGGHGNDTFVFTSPEDGVDHIVDFNTARDQIELYTETFTLATDNGHVDSNQFYSTTAAEFEADGYDFETATTGLIYLSDTGSHTGALYYDPDDSITGNEVLIANVTEDNTDPDTDLTAVDIDIV